MTVRLFMMAVTLTVALALESTQVVAQSAAAAAPSWTVDTIVVTAQRLKDTVQDSSAATKTTTPLIDTPQSIQVIDQSMIVEQDRRTLADALVNVSGVTPSKTEETVLAQPIVRGFAAEVYIDGLPAYGGTAIVDPASLVNTERIEVLKGPTAALYGGGIGAPLGGMINLVSKAPGPNFDASLALRGGSFGTVDPYFDVNAPLSADGRWLSRITGEYQKSQSYIDEVNSERVTVNPTLAVRLGEQTDLTLRGQYSRLQQLEYSGLPTSVTVTGPVFGDPYHFSGASDAPETTIENELVTLELVHHAGESQLGRLTARYYDSDFKEYGSFIFPGFYPPVTPTEFPLITAYLPTKSREYTVDGNWLVKAGAGAVAHELLFGVTYDRTVYDAALGFNFTPIGVVDYANPASDVAFGAVPPPTTFQMDRYQNLAGYVQDQVTIDGRLHLLAALRYTHLTLAQADNDLDQTYHKLTPRVGATLDVIPGVALFAGYAQGFRGTLNVVTATTPVPETSQSVEAGLKVAATSVGLSGTLAAFDLKRQKVPTPDPANPLVDIQTGEQRARGVEADFVWEPLPAFSLLANYAYTDARVTEDAVIPVGNVLPRVPLHSGRIAARYRFLGGSLEGLSLGAGLTDVGRRETTLPNTDGVPGYAALDAQASYTVARFTLGLSLVNLGGKRAFDPYQYLGQAVVIPIQTRSAFATLEVHF